MFPESNSDGDEHREESDKDKLLEIWKSSQLTSTLRNIGCDSFESAPEDAKKVWLFLGTKVFPRLSKRYRDLATKTQLTLNADKLRDSIGASDEALCLQIIDVKIEEILLCIERDKLTSEELNTEADQENTPPAAEGGKRKRTRPKKSEIKSKKRDKKAMELTQRLKDYNRCVTQLGELRKAKEGETEEGKKKRESWHEALVNTLNDAKPSSTQSGECGSRCSGSHASLLWEDDEEEEGGDDIVVADGVIGRDGSLRREAA